MSWFDEADALADKEAEDQSKLEDTKTFKFENEGDSIKGTVVGGKMVDTQYGQGQHLINIEDLDGQVWTVWCTNVVLKNELTDKFPAVGSGIYIRYEGKREPKRGGNPYKAFTLIAEKSDPDYWIDVMKKYQASGGGQERGSYSGDGRDERPFTNDGMEVPY